MSKQSKPEEFHATGEFIQLLPIKETERQSGVLQASVTKQRPSRAEVLSVGDGRLLTDGTLVKPPVKAGDIVLYNPHMFQMDYKDGKGRETVIVNTLAIYGRIS